MADVIQLNDHRDNHFTKGPGYCPICKRPTPVPKGVDFEGVEGMRLLSSKLSFTYRCACGTECDVTMAITL